MKKEVNKECVGSIKELDDDLILEEFEEKVKEEGEHIIEELKDKIKESCKKFSSITRNYGINCR